MNSEAVEGASSAEVKACLTCGALMERPRGVRRISEARWRARLFCSRSCTAPHAFEPCDDDEPSVPPEVASRNLLIALLRYGLRHDGLPGLAAPQLLALARQYDVAP